MCIQVFRKGGDIDLHEARVTISTPRTINVLKYAAVDRVVYYNSLFVLLSLFF
jgi:archaellin